ncbi:MAG: hypothetical protein KDL10_00950, partial [Kiritimatiellae bacterium]|nr:hypothetical protein [Kiritimatiellia bacterium]
GCGGVSQVRAAGSPFYDVEVLARIGDEVAGEDVATTYLATIDPQVCGNDLGRAVFVGVVSDTGGTRFWNNLIANASVTGGLHRLQNIDSHPASTWPGEYYEDPHLNNSNLVVVTYFTGDTGNGELTGAIGGTYDVDVVGGTDSNLTASYRLVFDGVCRECLGGPPGSVCLDGHALTMDDEGNVVIVGIRSADTSTCNYQDTDPNYLYINPPDTNLAWSSVAQLKDGTTGFGVPMAGRGPTTILKEGLPGAEDIVRVKDTGEKTVLASVAGGWSDLGAMPGISADGTVSVFGGTEPGGAPGIYIRILHPNWPGATNALVVGSNTFVAVDDATNIIGFASYEFQTNRLQVIREDVGGDGDIVGDRLTIAFIATPSAPSLSNPTLPGTTPMLFSGAKGLWTIELDVERELLDTNSIVINPRGVKPVLQVGDTLEGAAVTDIRLWDGLSRAAVEADGSPRQTLDGRPVAGDHLLTFWVDTSAGAKVVRASLRDRDDDGLPDHWEAPGGGIDMDRDGTVDLDLSAWGASVDHKDLFLEVDWLKNRTAGVSGRWRPGPYGRALQATVDFFGRAPVLNPDATTGVVIHIDGGPGSDPDYGYDYSYNTGTGNLQGGDEIAEQGTGESIDIIHIYDQFPNQVPGLRVRSIHDIKNAYFGTTDKRARELAFRYAVFGDALDIVTWTNGAPYVGQVAWSTSDRLIATTVPPALSGTIRITEGRGAGQVRELDLFGTYSNVLRVIRPWTIIPDASSRFVLFIDPSGEAEVTIRPSPNLHSLPGNDLIITMNSFGLTPDGRFASSLLQYRTLCHELGHTLGLRHGGIDNCQYSGDRYLSIMSYSHQTRTSTNQPVSYRCSAPVVVTTNLPLVNSFSTVGDPTFADWPVIQCSPYDNLASVGNTYQLGVGAEDDDHEFGVFDYLETFGELPDLALPVIEVLLPGPSTNIAPGGTLDVELRVTDESELHGVRVAFDIDGDGVTNGVGERVDALSLGGGLYAASF